MTNQAEQIKDYKGRTGFIREGWNFPAGNFTVIGKGQLPRTLEIAYPNGRNMDFDEDFIVRNLGK